MDIKWGALEILGFSYRREKKVKIEVDTARVAPVSAKPPTPDPPPTYSSDRAVGKDRGNGKGIPKERRTKEKTVNEIPKEERHWRK